MTDNSGPSSLCSRLQGTARTNGNSRNAQEKKVTPTRSLMQTVCFREASTMTDPIRRAHTDTGVQTAVDHVDKGTRTSPSPRKPAICAICQSNAPASPNHQSQGCDPHAPPPPSQHRGKVDVKIRGRSSALNESGQTSRLQKTLNPDFKVGSDTGGGGCGSGGCGDGSGGTIVTDMSWEKHASGDCGGLGGSYGSGCGSDGPGGSDSFPLSDVFWQGRESGSSDGSGCGSGAGSGSSPLQDVFWDERGMTWEVYGASVDPESLGVAIQSHLESKIREQADHIRTLRKSICSESGARAVREGRDGARKRGGARWYHCCSRDPEEE